MLSLIIPHLRNNLLKELKLQNLFNMNLEIFFVKLKRYIRLLNLFKFGLFVYLIKDF